MTSLKKNFIIFIVMAIAIGAITAWFTVFNKGTLIINTGTEDYIITLNEISHYCPLDPCQIELKAGGYQLRYEKTEYYTQTQNLSLNRWETKVIEIATRKILQLNESTFIKEVGNRPLSPASNGIITASSWNENGTMFLYLDQEDERLKLKVEGGEPQVVTKLVNINPPLNFYWSFDDNYVLITNKEALYKIDLIKSLKNKFIYEFEIAEIKWSPNSYDFLLSDGSQIYKTNITDPDDFMLMNSKFDLKTSEWFDDNSLITYEISNNNETKILLLNVITEEPQTLTQKTNFPIKEIYFDKTSNKIYFLHEKELIWYEIEI